MTTERVLTVAENQVLFIATSGMAGYKPGSFRGFLIQAMLAADVVNYAKLANKFPKIGAAIGAWRRGGLGDGSRDGSTK